MSKTPFQTGQSKKARGRWWNPRVEAQKDHQAIPDGLGIGVHEQRTGDGELVIYFRGNNRTPKSAWVVLGKFQEALDDGKFFYVSDRTTGIWSSKPNVTYHEDLLMAVSWIVELKEKWERENAYICN